MANHIKMNLLRSTLRTVDKLVYRSGAEQIGENKAKMTVDKMCLHFKAKSEACTASSPFVGLWPYSSLLRDFAR